MIKRIRRLLDLYELFTEEKLDGSYTIVGICYNAVLFATILAKEGMRKRTKDGRGEFDMTVSEYKFYLACRHAILCLPDDVREKLGKIAVR